MLYSLDNKLCDYTDEELVIEYNKGNNEAGNILIQRYDSMILKYSHKYFVSNGDLNDIIQEGRYGVFKAIKIYNKNSDASFKTFARLCIERQLITCIKTANRQKNLVLSNAISLQKVVDEYDNNSNNELITILKTKEQNDPSEIFERKETYKEIFGKIDLELSAHEKKVFEEYKLGTSYKDIAKKLNCKVKSVDTAITRIRRKANKIKTVFEKD